MIFRILRRIAAFSAIVAPLLPAQPAVRDSLVEFTYAATARRVSVAGDFNGWSEAAGRMEKGGAGSFTKRFRLRPGIYQYKFVVDGAWMLDPSNPASVPNYNNTASNSVFTLTDSLTIFLRGYMPTTSTNTPDTYPARGGTLFLNLIWHQHQPLYLDPATDQLQGPWVRTHGTKDYYDMAAILEEYPDVHYNVNLTSSLLFQLEEYYVKRLGPFVDRKRHRVDTESFFARWKGKTDPWIDLALKPTASFDSADVAYLLTNVWNAFGISEVQIARFPEYLALKMKAARHQRLTEKEMREVKFWFYIAHFDPDFLAGPVRLVDGTVVNVTDLIMKRDDSLYVLRRAITEDDCNRIVAETWFILSNIIPVHKKLMYHPDTHTGQIEVATTPFYHPILPLIYDTDLARICQPRDPMPKRFHYPQDAFAQVAKAVDYYTRTFGQPPLGMWPGEGSVAQEIVPIFGENGIRWIATDEKILARSKPPQQPKFYPYAVFADHSEKESVAVVFRDTELSDKIGFAYQNFRGEDAADDFIKSTLRYAPQAGEPDRLLTVILDGENAWEWYRRDNDGKEFLHALYRKLTALYASKQVVTVTMSEYMLGNPARGVSAHPIGSMHRLTWLYPGSWINANYDTWIGEDEENRAWDYLLTARQELGASKLPQPDPHTQPPAEGTKQWYAYKAWEEMYAAEGSDWFWWYGTDQTAPAGDKPFDLAYITHLDNLYAFARKAGGTMPARRFDPIILDNSTPRTSRGAMAQSRSDTVTVVFECDARKVYVRRGVFIAGNLEALGDWKPNTIRMYDDGSHGDGSAGDGVWTLEVQVPSGTVIQYKYTNSGPHEEWTPGEEFPGSNRTATIDGSAERVVIRNIFGTK